MVVAIGRSGCAKKEELGMSSETKVLVLDTDILVKRDGAWKSVHFQNTSVDAEAEQNDPIT